MYGWTKIPCEVKSMGGGLRDWVLCMWVTGYSTPMDDVIRLMVQGIYQSGCDR